jgi:hypothetical protein
MYLDNVQQVCGEFTGPFGDNYPDFWNQRNYPVMDVDNPGSPLITVPVDGLVQEIVIFECPGWAGPLNTKGNPCNGPVLTSTP